MNPTLHTLIHENHAAGRLPATSAALLGLTALMLVGCRTSPPTYLDRMPPVSVEDKPEALQPGYRALNEEGGRNYVLNQLELGIDAMQLGYDELAAQSLDPALDAIETVYGEDANARAARRLWNEEGRKTFKGEPYERAMAYYYRGLLYIQEGDLENARACFRAGIFQDSFVEEEQNRADFASLFYLEAWCSLMLGDTSGAEEPLRWLKKLRPDWRAPTTGDNLLIVAESGPAPRKLATGPGGAQLSYGRGTGERATAVEVAVMDGDVLELYPAEDVYWQASTRGGRPVDHILEGKVVFKKNWEAAGSAMTQAGLAGVLVTSQMAGKHRDRGMAIAGGVAALGIAAKLMADAVQPKADTRRVRNLPDTVFLMAVPATTGDHRVDFAFVDGQRTLAEQQAEVTIPDTGRAPGLAWTRWPRRIVSGRYVSP